MNNSICAWKIELIQHPVTRKSTKKREFLNPPMPACTVTDAQVKYLGQIMNQTLVLVLTVLALELTQPFFSESTIKNLWINSYGASTASFRGIDGKFGFSSITSRLFPFKMLFVVRDAIFYRADECQREKQKLWDTPASLEVGFRCSKQVQAGKTWL